MAGEEAGPPRVDGPAWGVWPATSPSGRSETTGRSFSWWKVASNTAGAGRRRWSQGKVGNHHRVHRTARGGSHCFLSPSALRGPSPSPSVRVRADPQGQRGCSAPRLHNPSDEGPESELTSLPHMPTPPQAKSSSRREGRKRRGREGHQDRSIETSRQEWVWSQRCFQPLQSRAVWPRASDNLSEPLCPGLQNRGSATGFSTLVRNERESGLGSTGCPAHSLLPRVGAGRGGKGRGPRLSGRESPLTLALTLEHPRSTGQTGEQTFKRNQMHHRK